MPRCANPMRAFGLKMSERCCWNVDNESSKKKKKKKKNDIY
jgi:hypothetical protein